MKIILFLILSLVTLDPIFASAGTSEIEELSKKNIDCLVKNAYYEAFGEGVTGMLIVNQVVFNRTKDNNYCKTIYQKRQFSWTEKKQKKIPAHIKEQLAELVIAQYNGIIDVPRRFKTAYFFHEKSLKPTWASNKYVIGRFRNHIFYKEIT